MIRTLDNRVSIQFVAINDDVSSFRSVFNSENARYIMLTVSLIINIFIFFGKVIEVIIETSRDERIKPAYIKNQIIKGIVWIILTLRKKTILYL